MSELRSQAAVPRRVQGRINYYASMEGRPQIFAGDYSRNVAKFEARQVLISDGSGATARTDLDREGFALVSHKTSVVEFTDKEQYLIPYSAEVREALLNLTGADDVLTLGSSGGIRRARRVARGAHDDTTSTVQFPHIDASDIGIRALLDSVLPDRPTNVRRWAFYNTWRALSPAPLDEPLTVCDVRSLVPQDLIPYDSHFPDGVSFESLMLRYSPSHSWTYFSNMTRDDLLVFKTNDSDPTRAHAVPHTAFHDPTSPSDALPRVSIELRAYACWFG